MPNAVTSKTFAQASTPSNRIVITIVRLATGTEYITDSELQFTFAPNNAAAIPTANKVQIYPTLIEKVIVASGSLSIISNVFGDQYQFAAGVPYDFSESGGLPVVLNSTPGNAFTCNAGANTTAQIVFRGYQGPARN